MSKLRKKNPKNQKDQQGIKHPATETVIELTDTALKQVTGALNPQPLPPKDPGGDHQWR